MSTDPPASTLAADEVERIRARADAATPGPWIANESIPANRYQVLWFDGELCDCCNEPDWARAHLLADFFKAERSEADALFAAQARTDIPRLLDALAAERARRERVEAELESMVWQFGYRRGGPKGPFLCTGGLSALESAFDALGWSDPRPSPEGRCDAKGCRHWASCGTPTSDGYKRLCGEHYQALADPAGKRPASDGRAEGGGE
jgi:hypothetical protein